MLARAAFLFCLIALPAHGYAATLTARDVAPGIWAIEGPAAQRDPGNLGNNATFGLVETPVGAVLIDPGATWKGAAALHDVVRTLTKKHVVLVIDTGGQDHRWLGNGYWKAHGATIVSSKAAKADQQARTSVELSLLSELVGKDGVAGTDPVYADTVFDKNDHVVIGGRRFVIDNPAPAHTPGDSFVWMPDDGVLFAGDIVFVGRALGVLPVSDSKGWLNAFAAIEALNPAHVVPGHGPATTLARAQADTRDYLANLRGRIGAHIKAGGDIITAVDVDQSAFAYLNQFDALAKRNAQAVFQQMEWE